jgi:hypothetical protein
VLGQTFFKAEQSARNRMNKLHKIKYIKYVETGLLKPRRVVVLAREGKRCLLKMGEDYKPPKVNRTTIYHNMMEQVADYYLRKIGKLERTTIATHRGDLYHIPDFIFKPKNGYVYNIEVELTKKSHKRYLEMMLKSEKDGADGIIFVTQTMKESKSLARGMDRWNRLFFIDIDSLIRNIDEFGRVKATKQIELLD